METEIESLRRKCDLMGIPWEKNSGAHILRRQIEEKSGESLEADSSPKVLYPGKVRMYNENQWSQKQIEDRAKEANRLVRVRVQCLDPMKKDWEGEIISVGSSKLGTFKKYVPYKAEEPYHIPRIIYEHLISRKHRVGYDQRDSETGRVTRQHKLVASYAVEVLPPLNERELKALAQKQSMAAGSGG
jgi:glycyl-tRNA synthetase (class II)